MKMQKKNFMVAELDNLEIKSFMDTINVLKTLQSNISELGTLVSPITGECVPIAELGKIIGILDIIKGNDIWSVEF